MTKQEEIREGLANVFFVEKYGSSNEGSWTELGKRVALTMADVVLSYLDSNDVVIKVERELALVPYTLPANYYKQGFNQALKTMAGYVAVEPLIGDKDA